MIKTVNNRWIFNITEEDLKNQWKPSPLEVLIEKYQSDDKHKGLTNLGNTCYINSIMQALFMTMDFREKILSLIQKEHNLSINNSISINNSMKKSVKNTGKEAMQTEEISPHDELYKLFFNMMTSSQKFCETKEFRESLPPAFRDSYQQQDASEFLRFYLDQLEKSLGATPYKNLINECFAGESEDTIECCRCEHEILRKVKFLDIGLSFDQDSKEDHDMLKMIKNSHQEEEFTDADKNQFYCETCKKLSPLAIKKSKPLVLPEYLILTLNRFQFDQQTQHRSKICSHVNIYEFFDFKNIFEHLAKSEGTAYSMYAIVVHSGSSAEQGHYYTFARELANPKMWFLFNDKIVLALGELNLTEYFKENETETPYMIFYKKDNSWNSGKRNF